jgi:hypothetical protein
MQGVDLELEELGVPVTKGLALQQSDLGVGPLQRTGGNRAMIPVEDSAAVRGQRHGELLEHADAAALSPGNPAVQEAPARGDLTEPGSDGNIST